MLSRLAPTRPEALLVTSFASAILVGTLLLCLPWSHQGTVGPLEALFTATSAVCVTGLIVVDTGTDFTFLGQLVILLLIQTGGLGVMTFAALAANVLGRRLTLREKAALTDTLVQGDLAMELRGTFLRIVKTVLLLEAAGALLLFVGLLSSRSVFEAGWSAAFHSISAFCNAGFSLYADSLMGLRSNPLVIGVVIALILAGGIGHPVLIELSTFFTRRESRESKPSTRLSLHARITLSTSLILLLGGALLLVLFGAGPTSGGFLADASAAIFQSVTARTAGFNTVDIGALPQTALLVMVVLMFIGGSPGSCAGGVKTTTVAIWWAGIVSSLRADPGVRMLGFHIPGDLIRRVWLILGLAVLVNTLGLLVLLTTEASSGAGFEELLFEQFSAFGTVGLSTGVTPNLSTTGRCWIILTMFAGRVGPLTGAMMLIQRQRARIRYPVGKVMIG